MHASNRVKFYKFDKLETVSDMKMHLLTEKVAQASKEVFEKVKMSCKLDNFNSRMFDRGDQSRAHTALPFSPRETFPDARSPRAFG